MLLMMPTAWLYCAVISESFAIILECKLRTASQYPTGLGFRGRIGLCNPGSVDVKASCSAAGSRLRPTASISSVTVFCLLSSQPWQLQREKKGEVMVGTDRPQTRELWQTPGLKV